MFFTCKIANGSVCKLGIPLPNMVGFESFTLSHSFQATKRMSIPPSSCSHVRRHRGLDNLFGGLEGNKNRKTLRIWRGETYHIMRRRPDAHLLGAKLIPDEEKV